MLPAQEIYALLYLSGSRSCCERHCFRRDDNLSVSTRFGLLPPGDLHPRPPAPPRLPPQAQNAPEAGEQRLEK